ncbi:mucin-5AC [Leptidea sinapis]|uniref:mucin-5AC n=1 Tax=Leptidea sinapis TaxID=189913 RepID=UPI0021C279B2|nr:mucin-5AC [Leptidea sinapis]
MLFRKFDMGSSFRIPTYKKMGNTRWLALLAAFFTFVTPALSSTPRVVCYYTNWSVYRPGTAKFNPQNINPYLCTHLVYAFGGFTKDNTLKPFDKYQDIEKGGYAKFNGLKTYNKNLKTLLAIGGWNEGSSRFSPMVAAKERRKEFVKNVIKFLRQNHFDGLDLDWEYPAFRDGGKPKDRENYAKLVKELRDEFDRESEKTGKPRLLLTMAVPAGIEYIEKGFDVETLNKYLDWMNLLTYDYHSAFEPAVNHHAPLYPLEEPNEYSVDNELNIDYTIKFYLENGADPDKLVLGIPTYGRSYTLFNPDAVEIGSPADGPGEQGDATREKGYLAFYEICEALKSKSKKREVSEENSEEDEEEEEDEEWTVMFPNKNAMGPVAYKGNQWVGYDDIDIVKKKGEYVAERGLGGIMFWSIDNDDFRGSCYGKPYPLIEAAKEAYISKLGSKENAITESSKSSGSSSRRRRPRPKASSTTTTTTTPKPSTRSNKPKSSAVSTTPTWNIITPEPPTTPDPGSDFKCKDEGFFPHPRDCKKYFWCLDSGPSDLGIVAHQFTCPSGLYFNKAADSCDFSRNVLCKMPSATAKPTTKPTPKTTVTTTTTSTTTTRRPVRLTSRSSLLFRTSTTTTPEPELSEEEEFSDEVVDTAEEDAEDPKVIKELIDLIKKVGGVEQLEKHLRYSETVGSSTADGTATTTPTPFNKKLYQKVLERARGKSKFNSNIGSEGGVQNSRSGPQNAGIEPSSDRDKSYRKDRPQYVTINRSRQQTTTEPLESLEEDETGSEEVQQVSRSRNLQPSAAVNSATTARQYVNIRRTRPTTVPDDEDDTPSRNALFDRSEPFVAVSGTPNTLDVVNFRKETTPEYVTIRRTRPTTPTTEATTTVQYRNSEEVQESKETAIERKVPSQAQPQYSSIIRTRSTTLSPTEEIYTPEPTTILSVQISSLLNAPSPTDTDELEANPIQTTELIESETTSTRSSSALTTTTSTTPPTTRRNLLRRRGSTNPPTTTSTAATSTQALRERRPFLRRTKPTTTPETTEDIETSTDKFNSRGNSKFKNRKTEKGVEKSEKPSLDKAVSRNEKPTRTFVRRRFGGANVTSSASTTLSTTAPPKRPFRIASRRRPFTTSTTTTTETAPTTQLLESEEALQDIDIDAIEDPLLIERKAPKNDNEPRRRPLIALKSDDQNPSATNDEKKERQSKKYSSSFRQNQLDEIIKARTSAEVEITTEGKTTVDVTDVDNAVALAAHQLLAAPVPITQDYDEPKTTRRSRPTSRYSTTPYTELPTNTAYTQYNRNTVRQGLFETSTFVTETPTFSTIADSTRPTYSSTSYTSRPTYTTTSIPTLSGVSINIGSEGSGESTARYTFEPSIQSTTYEYESRVSRPKLSTINPTVSGVSLDLGESTARFAAVATNTGVPATFPSTVPNKFSRPAAFSPNLVSLGFESDEKSVGFKSTGPSTARYESSSAKIPVPVNFSPSSEAGLTQETSYFTREYLLESPVTKAFEDDIQYLSSTTPSTTRRPLGRRRTVYRRISTTRPTSPIAQTTVKPRRTTIKPFEKITVREATGRGRSLGQDETNIRPAVFASFDDGQEKLGIKYEQGTKVHLDEKGNIECLDVGNFPHPTSCKKFISCARIRGGSVLGWEYICPKGLSFDPVGGICNWSAGLGCNEKDN